MIPFLSLKNNLKEIFHPLIVISGNDEWLKSRAIDLIGNSLDLSNADMNRSCIDRYNVDDLLMVSNTLPFFSAQKLVVATNVILEKNGQKAVAEKLNNYIYNSDKSCCLVIVANDDAVKYLSQVKCERVDCSRLSDSDVVKWIVANVKSNGSNISNQCATLLCDYCLGDMSRVASETKKLCDYGKDNIDEDMIDSLVVKDVQYVVFDLAQKIADKNTAIALDALSTLLRQGNDGRGLFRLLYSYYRRLYYCKITKGENNEVAEMLGVRPNALYYTQKMVKNYNARQLLRALELLEMAEKKLINFANEQDTLQYLLLQLVAL